MTRIEHYNEPGAPPANRLVPAASAVVTDEDGRILLARRRDNDLWTIPGGAMEPGETIAQAALREVKEETGIDAEIDRLVGIYSNPHHVIEYGDGEVRQQFSVCFACRAMFGMPTESPETSDVRYFAVKDLGTIDMHPSIRLRIDHYLEDRPEPYLG